MSDNTMRAMVLRAEGARLESARVPIPQPGPNEARVRVTVCSVGLTVVNSLSGFIGGGTNRLPRIPGHEIVGVVDEVGPGVTNVKLGDRVLNYGYLNCGTCYQCSRGRQPLCTNLRGMPGVQADGGYAEYCVLPAHNWVNLPDDVSDLDASAIVDAITTSYHVISDRGQVRPGDIVTVIGAAGGVGIHLVQMARVFGGEVIAVDIDDAKLERTREYGAGTLINFTAGDVEERFQAATRGRGSDVVIDMVGRPETLEFAARALGRGGRGVFLTVFPGLSTPFEPRAFVNREAVLMGSRYASRSEMMKAIELVREKKIRPVVSEICTLEQVESLHDSLRAATFFGRGAIVFE